MGTKFLDPRTGKMVEFEQPKPQQQVQNKPKPEAKQQRKFLTLEENVLEEPEVLDNKKTLEEQYTVKKQDANILNKKFINTSQFIDHIILLLNNRKIEDACDIYAHSQEDIGYLLINRMSGDKSLMKILANMFFKSRDFSKAAIVCEHIEEFEKAAQLYERSDDYFMAAESYIKVGLFEKAANMYEKNQNYTEAANLFSKLKMFERAAYNYEKCVNVFLAGKLYYQVKNFKKSMELLQKIEPQNEYFLEATKLIGTILSENGYLDLAIRKLEAIKENVGLNEETEEIYYELGRVYLQKNDVANGKQVLGELRNYNFYYKDVNKLLEEVKNGKNPLYEVVDEVDVEIEVEVEESNNSGYVSVMEGFEYLSTLPIFSELTLDELKSLYNMTETLLFSEGDYLIHQNQPGQGLFIIRAGDINIVDETVTPAKLIVSLSEGVTVGEMSLVEDAKTSASVIAKTDVLAFKIGKEEFNKLLSSNDRIARKIYLVFIKTLSERLRKTNEKLNK